jgi:DhnA family fructose-bisphosphate aldolase class Ia
MRGKEIRLRRLLKNGKAVIVPMDHPVYFGPIKGIEDPTALVKDVAQTPAQGLLLTLATLARVSNVMGNLGSIARIDGTHTALGKHLTDLARISSVEYAVACGADACALNIYIGADNEKELMLKLGETAEDCERWGLPLVGEMIPSGTLAGHYNQQSKKLSESEITEQIALASRVGAEVGADIIKTNYTGSQESFRHVVQTATVPILVAGGPCGDSVADLLVMVENCMLAGAIGVCIGRNVWQRPNRKEVLAAICRIVHEGVPAAKALKI